MDALGCVPSTLKPLYSWGVNGSLDAPCGVEASTLWDRLTYGTDLVGRRSFGANAKQVVWCPLFSFLLSSFAWLKHFTWPNTQFTVSLSLSSPWNPHQSPNIQFAWQSARPHVMGKPFKVPGWQGHLARSAHDTSASET